MDGARYLEDGKLTIFQALRGLLRTTADFTGEKICLAFAEDLRRVDCYSTWSAIAVPNRTESRSGTPAKIRKIFQNHR
jgi:hypothetical protein